MVFEMGESIVVVVVVVACYICGGFSVMCLLVCDWELSLRYGPLLFFVGGGPLICFGDGVYVVCMRMFVLLLCVHWWDVCRICVFVLMYVML